MNPDIKAAWLEALRSGDYQQGRGTLRQGSNQFCCLGVLCDLHSKATGYDWEEHWYLGIESHLPMEVADWAGLSIKFRSDPNELPNNETSILLHVDYQIKDLARLNDNGSTFQDIANLIEEHITASAS